MTDHTLTEDAAEEGTPAAGGQLRNAEDGQGDTHYEHTLSSDLNMRDEEGRYVGWFEEPPETLPRLGEYVRVVDLDGSVAVEVVVRSVDDVDGRWWISGDFVRIL